MIFTNYSHSIVPGGFDEMSYVHLLTPETSFVIRLLIFLKTAGGKSNQSAVIKSSELTALNTITWSYVLLSPCTPTALTGNNAANACAI